MSHYKVNSDLHKAKSCTGKVAHTSMEHAQQSVSRVFQLKGELLVAYKCMHCTGYHTGHPKTQAKGELVMKAHNAKQTADAAIAKADRQGAALVDAQLQLAEQKATIKNLMSEIRLLQEALWVNCIEDPVRKGDKHYDTAFAKRLAERAISPQSPC